MRLVELKQYRFVALLDEITGGYYRVRLHVMPFEHAGFKQSVFVQDFIVWQSGNVLKARSSDGALFIEELT